MLQTGRSRVRFPMRSLNFFNLPNSSSRTMALGWTQHLTEMSTRRFLGGKWQRTGKADNLTAICEPIVYNSVSQPPGRGRIPSPDINYTGPTSYKKRNYRAAFSQRLRTTGLQNVGASTSHNLMGLHDLLQGQIYLYHGRLYPVRCSLLYNINNYLTAWS
jgi:hypothetical protein